MFKITKCPNTKDRFIITVDEASLEEIQEIFTDWGEDEWAYSIKKFLNRKKSEQTL